MLLLKSAASASRSFASPGIKRTKTWSSNTLEEFARDSIESQNHTTWSSHVQAENPQTSELHMLQLICVLQYSRLRCPGCNQGKRNFCLCESRSKDWVERRRGFTRCMKCIEMHEYLPTSLQWIAESKIKSVSAPWIQKTPHERGTCKSLLVWKHLTYSTESGNRMVPAGLNFHCTSEAMVLRDGQAAWDV